MDKPKPKNPKIQKEDIMSRFYGNLQGDKGEATRCGHKTITSHVRGWDFGVRVTGYINNDGEDCFDIVLTSGSNGDGENKFLGNFTRKDLGE